MGSLKVNSFLSWTAFCVLVLFSLTQLATSKDVIQSDTPITTMASITQPNNGTDRSTKPIRYRRMYAMCPPKFVRIGNECYYISTYKANWLDAHFECKDRHSKLAEPLKFEDKRIRKYLLTYDKDRTDKWLGANYNWEKMKWQWGYSGRDLTYQAFSQMTPGARAQLKYHCAVFSADLKYRWSPRQCIERRYFICQHRMPYVSKKNREKIYQKWNETFPNELANEIEVIVSNGQRNPYNRFVDSNSRDANRVHFFRTVTPRYRPSPTRNDINPANYGDTRPSDRRSRQYQRNYHSASGLDKIVFKKPRLGPDTPHLDSLPLSTSHMVNNEKTNLARDFTRPNQVGQRVGGIKQKIEYDQNGNPILKQNVGQWRFGLDRPIDQSHGEGHRKQKAQPNSAGSQNSVVRKLQEQEKLRNEQMEQHRQQREKQEKLRNEQMEQQRQEIEREKQEQLRKRQEQEKLRNELIAKELEEQQNRKYEEQRHQYNEELKKREEERQQVRQKSKYEQELAQRKQHEEMLRKQELEIEAEERRQQEEEQSKLDRQREEVRRREENEQKLEEMHREEQRRQELLQRTTTTTTTTAPTTAVRELSEDERKKKAYREALRKRLAKLSPEEQREFFKMRQEKKKTKPYNDV